MSDLHWQRSQNNEYIKCYSKNSLYKCFIHNPLFNFVMAKYIFPLFLHSHTGDMDFNQQIIIVKFNLICEV